MVSRGCCGDLRRGPAARCVTSRDCRVARTVSLGVHSAFVIGGVRREGEFPHPLGVAFGWTGRDLDERTGSVDALPGLAGESPFELVAPFDGRLTWRRAHRLQEAGQFLHLGRRDRGRTQVDDLFGGPLSRVSAMAVSDDVFVAGGETGNRAFDLDSNPRP